MTYCDYVVTEAGFGADLGAEKFFDIKCRKAGLHPRLVVIVATTQGLKMHGGVSLDNIKEPNAKGLTEGLKNLNRHIRNMQGFGQPVIVTLNRFDFDTDEEIDIVRKNCEDLEVGFAVNEAFLKGGEGAVDLAQLVVDTIDKQQPLPIRFTYKEADCLEDKIEKVCKRIYGASAVEYGQKVIVAIAGDMVRMPGLPKSPQAERITIENGEIEGLS